VDAPRIGDTGAQLLYGQISVGVYQRLDQCVSGRVQGRSLAASMRFGRNGPRRAVPA
jgi:hypothetical protein